MPKIAYLEKRLGRDRLEIISKANAIIEEYRVQGFELTLRQLYYQFVARGYIANNQREYGKLGDVIADGRLTGLVDWTAIVDLTRSLKAVPHWSDPSDIIEATAQSFRIDKWADQDWRPEVWIEKDALAGVISGVCAEQDIPYFSCRGYTSLSEMWMGAMRMKRHLLKGQTPLVLHFGDHDPSGRDMTRDIRERLELFMGGVEVKRLALNMDQIEQYNPPPNPAKISDSRAAAYIAEFGDESWELDALEPRVLADLIRTTIAQYRDEEKWEQAVEREERDRELLERTSQRWDDVVDLLEQ